MSGGSTGRNAFDARVRMAPVLAGLGLLLAAAAGAVALTHGLKSPGSSVVYPLVALAVGVSVVGLGLRMAPVQGLGWVLALAAAAGTYAFRAMHVSPRAEAADAALNWIAVAAVLAPLVVGIRLASPAQGALLAAAVALTGLSAEWIALFKSHSIDETKLHDILWTGDGWHHERHPTMGLVYRPWGWMKAWYPTNMRDYFEVETPSEAVDVRTFAMNVEGDVTVELSRPEQRDQPLEIAYKSPTPGARPPVVIYTSPQVVAGKRYALKFRARSPGVQRVRAELTQTKKQEFKFLIQGEFDLAPEWQELSIESLAADFGGEMQLKFLPLTPNARLELNDIRFSGPLAQPAPKERFAVSYAFNGDGFRDRPWQLAAAPNVTRIAMLGDSFTVGYGVHAQDLASRRLEDELNRDAGPRRFEVMNFATVGFSTRQERACFQACIAKYRPQVLLLMMVANDPVSMEEENEMGSAHLFKKMEQSTGLTRETYRRRWEAIEAIKQQFEEKCVPEIRTLADRCREIETKLMVVYYRFSDEANWLKLVHDVDRALAGSDVPTLDLYSALRADHDFESLKVHQVDGHPNEIANRLAADALAKQLRQLGWLEPAVGDKPTPPTDQASQAVSAAP